MIKNLSWEIDMGGDQRLMYGRKNVVVGVRFDSRVRELLDWAILKVADQGDTVVAIHVSRNSGTVDCSDVSLMLF